MAVKRQLSTASFNTRLSADALELRCVQVVLLPPNCLDLQNHTCHVTCYFLL
jgi:hypothetical protein